ncbi:MAG: FxLYD domain-containing protein [Sphingobacteriales bacterium]|nr:FxLYD domain-containing protein [Sphingobacteriales bacterium]
MKSIALILALVAVGFTSCNSSDKKAEKGKDKYEQTKESLGDSEKHNPQRFISIEGHDKHNLIGQTVVKGTLTNKASVSSFKDVNIEISFYSKTGTLLEKDQETVYETLAPGDSKNFKTKYFAPKGTDSVSLKVLGARSE